MPAPSSPSCGNVRSRFSNRADVTALLAAFCFFLSAIEYMLPKPLPFMRLGIANLPILLAVDMLPFNWFLVLAAAKVVGMSIVSGTLFSYVALFSLAGTMVAALVMRGVRRTGGHAVSLVGVSVAGAVTSNAMQMLIARYVIFGEVAWLIAPLFLVTGLVTGTVMGFFAEFFIEHSSWYSCAMGKSDELDLDDTEGKETDSGIASSAAAHAQKHGVRTMLKQEARQARRERYACLFKPWISALTGFLVAIIFLLQQEIVVKLVFMALFIAWTWLAGKRFSLVSTIVVSAGIVAANLLIPSGRVLFKLGPLAVTQFALTEGISKALTFEGLMYLSKASIMAGLQFPGRFGAIIAQAFQYYDRIIEYRGKVHAKTVVRDVDALMQRVWASAQPTETVSAWQSRRD
ncbi:MAG: Gx transporter family protein [Rectinema subterraneum]